MKSMEYSHPSNVPCLTCDTNNTRFQKRPAKFVEHPRGIGIWCNPCDEYEAFCTCPVSPMQAKSRTERLERLLKFVNE